MVVHLTSDSNNKRLGWSRLPRAELMVDSIAHLVTEDLMQMTHAQRGRESEKTDGSRN
jgi:hypothetical protein